MERTGMQVFVKTTLVALLVGALLLPVASCDSGTDPIGGGPTPPDPIERASVDSAGAEGNSFSFVPGVSGDGRHVVFYSGASNLVAGDSNGFPDVFVRDVTGGTTSRVNVSSAGAEADTDYGGAFFIFARRPAISSDGRYIAFPSDATNLVAGDTNGTRDVFLRDTVAGTTTRVSLSNAGGQVAGGGSLEAMSADGRYVAFVSSDPNVVAGDTNGFDDVFVRDTVGGTTTRASVDSSGTEANGSVPGPIYPSISGNGRYVAFTSVATNLVASDGNGFADVFVRDTVAGTTTRVSVDSAGVEANGFNGEATISADGRYVAFHSSATNLVANDTNGFDDVFVRDLVGGTTTLISVGTAGSQADGLSLIASISEDGRYVAFKSSATNLIANDTNGRPDIFVRDTVAGTTMRASVDSAGTEIYTGEVASFPTISADGRYVVFESSASTLVPGDTNGVEDVFRAPAQ